MIGDAYPSSPDHPESEKPRRLMSSLGGGQTKLSS